jgi:Icc-related predicted phosphoesterase
VAKKSVRLYVVSDIHGSEKAWRKMLNAARMRLYDADAVLFAGDLTGKAMVPVVRTNGGYRAEFAGQVRQAHDEKALESLEQDIANLGFYSVIVSADEAEQLRADPEALEARFNREISTRVEQWMTMAAERMADSGVPIYCVPGNDDPYAIDEVLERSPYVKNVDGQVADMPGDLQVIGSGKSNPTPWHTPREVSDDAFGAEVTRLADEARDPKRSVFLIHCPPFGSGIDTAPLLDQNLRPRVTGGDLMRGPVGSTGVRKAIEEFRPLLSLHGHIHESGGDARVGKTLCLNPGSEAAFGILRGYLVDISSNGVERTLRVEG